MAKTVVYMSVSVDGFVAAEGDGPGRGLGVGGEPLHAWLRFDETAAGDRPPLTGADAEVFDELMGTGAVVTGRHTFEWAGEWGGDHHDGVPVFVLTRDVPADREPGIVRYTSDLAGAVAQAKEAAGDRDVLVHGASAVRSLLAEGLVDELALTVVPLLLGRGRRLFDDAPPAGLRLLQVREGDGVLHLRYAVAG